eukprot:197047_1
MKNKIQKGNNNPKSRAVQEDIHNINISSYLPRNQPIDFEHHIMKQLRLILWLFALITCTLYSYQWIFIINKDISIETTATNLAIYTPIPKTHESIQEKCNLQLSKNMKNKQDILYQLAHSISSNNYKTFNSDIKLNNKTYQHFSTRLLRNTFANKTMIFFGDSTMYRFYIFNIWCLHHEIHGYHSNYYNACQFKSSLLNHNYNIWHKYLSPQNEHPETITSIISNIHILSVHPNVYVYIDRFINTTLYLYENRWDYNIDELFNLYETWIELEPNIIFWNPSGLHLLHLWPLRPFQYNSHSIINKFEENLLKIYNVSKQANAIMIYRGTSPLCLNNDNEYYSNLRWNYKKMFRIGLLFNNYTIGCALNAQTYGMKSDKIMNACRNWTFTNEGIIYQNNIIKKFVYDMQHNIECANYTNVFFYDRYNVFHSDVNICASESVDVAHWMDSYGADAMYFVNAINILTQ